MLRLVCQYLVTMLKFIKSFSIYGLIPIFGKFISILLLPLYARLLSPEDYGAQDILVQIAIFLTFLIDIEIYSGVGRYFYERKEMQDKRLLVSTGFWITVMNGLVILLLVMFLNKALYGLFFNGLKYSSAFYLSLMWALISAIYTYFLVIMRYEQKPRLYFTLVNIQLLIRILSTVIFVAIYRLGVLGVIAGHILGEFSAAVMFFIALKKYLIFRINWSDLKEVARFSLPLVPAVFVISLEKPVTRFLVTKFLSVTDMGYFSMALQIVLILSFVQSGLMMSWQPHLFELITKPNYQQEVRKIYSLFLNLAGMVCFLVILNGRLLLRFLTTPAYFPAAPIIGFLAVKSFIEIIRQISGCGPAVAKKTELNMYYEIIASLTTVGLFILFHKFFGIVGLAIAMLVGTLLKFVWSWLLTVKLTSIRINPSSTIIAILGLIILVVIEAVHPLPISVVIGLSFFGCGVYIYFNRRSFLRLGSTFRSKHKLRIH